MYKFIKVPCVDEKEHLINVDKICSVEPFPPYGIVVNLVDSNKKMPFVKMSFEDFEKLLQE